MSNVEAIHRFPDRLAIRVPAGLPAAVEAAARYRLTSPSEWARRALLAALRADGLHLDEDGQVRNRARGTTRDREPTTAPKES
jgi:hypothetical protein